MGNTSSGDALTATEPLWSRGWFWWLLALLSLAPFLIAPLPMLPDYFSHTARYHVMNHGADSPWLGRYYDFRWALIGNLGVDLLMVPLGRLLPTETAALIAVAIIPPLTIAGIHALARAVWGRIEAPALLALPFVFSSTFAFGLVNYHLSVALALLGLALWIRRADRPAPARWAVFGPLSLLVWVTHVSGWAAMLVLIACWEAWRARAGGATMARAFIAAAVRALPLALPLVLILFWRSDVSGAAAATTSLASFSLRAKLVWVITMLRAEVRWFDLASIALLLGAAVVLLREPAVRRAPGLLLGSAALGICFLVLPGYVFGSFMADARLLPLVAITLFTGLAVPPGRARTWVAVLGLALFTARTGIMTVAWHQRGTAAVADLHALDTVPRGSRIAVAAVTSDCETWHFHGRDHLASLAVVRRDAFVNTLWDIQGQQLMQPVYNRGHGFNDTFSTRMTGRTAPCDGRPLAVMLADLPRDRFDYVWVFDGDPVRAAWLRPVSNGPNGRLYKIIR